MLNTLSFKKLLSLVLLTALLSCNNSVVKQGSVAFDMQLVDLNGKAYPLVADKQVNVITFFATWCGVCQSEVESLNRLQSTFPNLRIISVTTENDLDAVREFSKQTNFKILIAKDENILQKYGVTAYPETVVIGKSGKFMTFKDPDDGSPTIKILGARNFTSEIFLAEIRRLMNDTSGI